VHKTGRVHWCRLNLERQPMSPTAAVLGFAKLLAMLPRRSRAIWTAATSKEFDIGIQGGIKPLTSEWVLEPEAIQAAAQLGAQLRITMYSPAWRTAPKGCEVRGRLTTG